MREIKFRVYIKETKEMLPVVSIVQMNDEKGLRVFPQGYDRNFLESEGGIVLMQYTGLKDKNGKEVYVGVGYNGYDDFNDTEKGTVGKVGTITGICPDGTYIINNEAFFPSWSIAPAFDDDKSTKIQELESQLAQIQKELELLKK